MSKKIAILTPTFNYYSGIDRVAQRQAEDYAKKGHDVTVITLEAGIKNPKGYKIVELGMPKNSFLQRVYRLFFFLDIKKMQNYKLFKGYDQVISHYYPMTWLAHKAKKRYNLKYIYHSHFDNVIHKEFYFLHKIYMYLLRFFNNWAINNVDKIYCVSEYVKKELLKHLSFNEDKYEVRLNSINKKIFNKNIKGGKIRKKYNIKDNKVFLYVGRLAPHKRIDLLIKRFKAIQQKNQKSKLLIVGKPTFNRYFKKLKKLADENVIFTDFVPDEELPYYYGACDFYVTASYDECFDIPAAQAQACGKPVIAFKIGSHEEVVKKGKLVKEGDVEGFANAMIRYANSI